MSLEMRLGGRGNLLSPGPGSYNQIMLKSPVLLESELAAVVADSALGAKTFSLHYAAGSPSALQDALGALCGEVEAAVRAGCQCVVLSDKGPMDPAQPPIPPLLATGAVHHHLIRKGARCCAAASPLALLARCVCLQPHAAGVVSGQLLLPLSCSRFPVGSRTFPPPSCPPTPIPTPPLPSPGLRTETSIAVETAQCFSTHHVAMLVGYGAHAVCPYLAFEACRQWRASPRTQNLVKAGKLPDVSAEAATANYKKAVEKGILKILSKMGISLLSCYHGAQVCVCWWKWGRGGQGGA
jgi:hypothetical protein